MIIDYILLVLGLILLVPVSVLFIQVIFASFSYVRLKSSVVRDRSHLPSIAVIVPAHNEEHGIAKTIEAITPQLSSNTRLVVVADNCSDNTASIARTMGAITLKRHDEKLRGKGYALDYALKYLADNPPEVVIIVDADCIVASNLIETLSLDCILLNRPVQANYIMTYQDRLGLKQQVTEFAWLVKNTVRPLGFKYLGLPCQLMGTGMAFKWSHLAACNLANGHLVEDMQLGLDLAKISAAPVFTIDTHVSSYFPMSVEGETTQRARWEHGHLSIIFGQLPKLIREACLNANKQLFAQLLDISVPPLALLFITVLCLMFLSIAVWVFTGGYSALAINSFLMGTLGLSIFIAWVRFGRDIISFRSLMMAPLILLCKLPVYVSFVFNRQVEWVRSKRD